MVLGLWTDASIIAHNYAYQYGFAGTLLLGKKRRFARRWIFHAAGCSYRVKTRTRPA